MKLKQIRNLKDSIKERRPENRLVSIISASFGDGHNTAANGVVEALNSLNIKNTGLVDLLEHIHPTTMNCLSNGYRTITTKWPNVWKKLYDLAERVPFGDGSYDFMPSITNGFCEYLKETKPDAVISTYPLYGHIIERIFGTGELPFKFITMITDSKSINKSWFHKASGQFAVIDQISADCLVKNGISSDRIHITGFPVSPNFTKNCPKKLEQELPDVFRLLYTPTSSDKKVESTLLELNNLIESFHHEISMTIVMGRHSQRLEKIVKRMAPKGSTILGWTKNMSNLICESHLMIGKAGGASVQEAIASACPMIIDSIIPGQEEGNAELITNKGSGMVALNPKEIRFCVEKLLEDDGKGWLKARKNCLINKHPEAAFNLAKMAI